MIASCLIGPTGHHAAPLVALVLQTENAQFYKVQWGMGESVQKNWTSQNLVFLRVVFDGMSPSGVDVMLRKVCVGQGCRREMSLVSLMTADLLTLPNVQWILKN